ncbi:Butyrophilin-like protein 2 [Labeo rohita]|uniref:Butyrophilin-like protein 2 n=1 Tax=Labeo rohita TaxID=84645 RepID=A0ABQ8L9E4_LABRO|nr:Butyrophilin-like protein 2 [Labeo rohita]
MLYVFESVGVVLLNCFTAALMTELILKAVNGERAVGDLIVVFFSTESLFSFSFLILLLFEPCGFEGCSVKTHQMMQLSNGVWLLILLMIADVVLPCYVNELLLMEGLEVEWRKTGSGILVHLYQDGESRAESQHQEYHDRAHFFTDQIQHGNFSLHLDNLRAEDQGRYTCRVHNQRDSGETVVQIKDVERLLVSGSSRSISASVGEDVTLNCSVDSHITPEHTEEVSWRKTDEDEDFLVLLYQNNETFSDSSDERYRDRVEFFTAEIPKGNFSLRLKSVRTEDKGVYMCQVFAGGLSANATARLELGLGGAGDGGLLRPLPVRRWRERAPTRSEIRSDEGRFSTLHIIMLILCVSASGSALLLCCLIYCRSHNNGFTTKHSGNMFVPLGGSVVLPCHFDKRLLKTSLKVEWRRPDSKTLIHLYQDGAEYQQQDYHDRAHFFTDQIQHGNFSLRLDNLTAEDEGRYTCKVYRCAVGELNPKIAPLGSSVVLSCYGDKRLFNEGLKVEWRRTDSGTLVHLYQDGESRPESQQQDYHDRAHFFTDQIHHGNFSLRLDNLTAEDLGQYTCRVYRFVVEHSSHRVVPQGSSVVLPCYVDGLLLKESLKVEWRRTGALVHLYQDGESQPEKQQQDYRDRAHFFTDQIQHGNFSLRLDNLTAEDEGQYTCTIYSQQKSVFSAETHLVLKLLVLARFINRFSERTLTRFGVLVELHRVVPVYVFGSVGVVVLNSVALMTELILKTVNGDRTVGDLRVIVFSTEGLFALSLLSLQNAAGSDETPANESNQRQNTAESREMNPLLNQDQDAGRTEETQPDSVESQT